MSDFRNRYYPLTDTGAATACYCGELVIERTRQEIGKPIITERFLCVCPHLKIATTYGYKYGVNPAFANAPYEEDEQGEIFPRNTQL